MKTIITVIAAAALFAGGLFFERLVLDDDTQARRDASCSILKLQLMTAQGSLNDIGTDISTADGFARGGGGVQHVYLKGAAASLAATFCNHDSWDSPMGLDHPSEWAIEYRTDITDDLTDRLIWVETLVNEAYSGVANS